MHSYPSLACRAKNLSLAVILGLSVTAPSLVPLAQAESLPTEATCAGDNFIMPNHPDLQSLMRLHQTYLGFIPMELELGMPRQDIGYAIYQFEQSLKVNGEGNDLQPVRDHRPIALSAADQATLTALNNTYAQEIANARVRLNTHTPLTGQDYLNTRLSSLEARTAPLNSQQFSTTTKLQGEVVQSRDATTPPPNVTPPASPAPLDEPSQLPSGDTTSLPPNFNTESYNRIQDNPFLRPNQAPLSTFSVDVDTASYSNVRRFIRGGQLPPKDAVRIEELVNYFGYDYPNPDSSQPFSVSSELTNAPWDPQHKLVQIGLKGQSLSTQPPSNLVFLIDVSGSMESPDKLGLVKRSLCLLVNELRPEDRISLVVYAGNAGLVLPPTPGDQKQKILNAINNLEAGGSTAGGEGLQLAYKQAESTFLPQGNNRVILATDGDFNIGQSSDAEMERLIESKRDKGIFLTVLGYGTGNYKDSKMETLADKGNGNYAYIDTIQEAQKVLVNDVRGTLFTIAKDVKIQVEFNPKLVQAYRLIGYENRILQAQDFNDDKKDAGEIGAGHTVTALYEIIPTGVTPNVKLPDIDDLKYQTPTNPSVPSGGNELMSVKLRYKQPQGNTSELLTRTIQDQVTPLPQTSGNFRFAAAVAMYGMILRDSDYKGQGSLSQVRQLAEQSLGNDPNRYRQGFLELVRATEPLLTQATSER